MSILTKPSFWANGVQGLLILLLLMVIWFSCKDMKKWSLYEKIIVISLFALVIGVHGLLHLGLESVYDWNPLEKKWI